MVETLRWKNGKLELIDQRLLPWKLKYIKCTNDKEVFDAIKKLKVRGAPAIGVAGGFGVFLGVKNNNYKDVKALVRGVEKSAEYLSRSRPTAVNLFWALDRMVKLAHSGKHNDVRTLKTALFKEAKKILKEDQKICRDLGRIGSGIVPKNARVLTHCNAGGLATADYGTALGVIFSSAKKIKKVYVDETRPVLQGARLTAWEIVHAGLNATLICDNMAGHVMSEGCVDLIVTGADRIASNGDTANKIGTYSLAVLAARHRIPFYIAAPLSTFDMNIKNGGQIPIEQRDPDEVRKIGNSYITLKNVDVYNPAFDVTPAGLITGIITEKGIIKKPDRKKIAKLFSR